MVSQRRNRPGFTLLELLVVIAIIAILAALTVRGTFQVIQAQQAANTETLMRTVNQKLEKHWAKVVEEARTETGIPKAVRDLAGGHEERTRVIWIKFRLVEAFPISYNEINNAPVYANDGNGNPYIPTNKRKYVASYVKKLNGKTAATDPTTESSACLLIALGVTRAGSALTLDGLGSNASDTDGDGVKEIVDSFGKALAFYRFPTTNSFLQKSNPAPPGTEGTKFADPLDPKGYLLDPNWTSTPPPLPTQPTARQTFEAICGNGYKVSASVATQPAYYTVPTLVSGGRNQLVGLNLDMSVANTVAADDNIYSFRIRQGAQGN